MKKAGPLTMVLVLFLGLSGCAPASKVMFNPMTGKIGRCAAGIAAAKVAQERCVADLKMVGYIEIERYGVVGMDFDRTKLTDPLMVLKVVPGSPAAVAGVKPGDQVIARDDTKINTMGDFLSLPIQKPGVMYEYKVRRAGQDLIFRMRAVPYPEVHNISSQ